MVSDVQTHSVRTQINSEAFVLFEKMGFGNVGTSGKNPKVELLN